MSINEGKNREGEEGTAAFGVGDLSCLLETQFLFKRE